MLPVSQSTHSGALYKLGITIMDEHFILTGRPNLNMPGTSFILSKEFQSERVAWN